MGGEVINTGTLRAPAGEVTLSAVSGGDLVRLGAAGAVSSVEVASDAIANQSMWAYSSGWRLLGAGAAADG
ncbi:MAG: hypothetical protein AAF716_03905 [Cyanobacteria bacterium P01_D01_bin.1]